MNKHVLFIWRTSYRKESRPRETVLEVAQEKARQILERT
jgi:predicted house-cleaning NTP pyrophosphatase (Maf/HAM1 superfamily)